MAVVDPAIRVDWSGWWRWRSEAERLRQVGLEEDLSLKQEASEMRKTTIRASG